MQKKQIGLFLLLFALFALLVNTTIVPSEVQLAADKAAEDYVKFIGVDPDGYTAAAG